MKGIQFPIHKSKVAGSPRFQLEDPKSRKKYFALKVGAEIKAIQKYLKHNSFVAFLLGKKNSGKGTYSKLFMEAIGAEYVAHLSVGDIVRRVDADLKNPKKKRELLEFLKSRYRGFMGIEKALESFTGRSTSALLPTEMILALVEREVDKLHGKAVFIDGFPRDLDQVSYSLYFRAIMGYREDPDFFVFIDVPESAVDERIKYRVVYPICSTPRNTKLLRTKEIAYDAKKKTFQLLCDNPNCKKAVMVAKEGDSLGIEAIRDRMELDEKVIRSLLDLQGVPKIYLRNAIPVGEAKKYVNDYEVTPAYEYSWNEKKKQVDVKELPWQIKDDDGVPSYSLLPPPVAISLIKQIAKVLGFGK